MSGFSDPVAAASPSATPPAPAAPVAAMMAAPVVTAPRHVASCVVKWKADKLVVHGAGGLDGGLVEIRGDNGHNFADVAHQLKDERTGKAKYPATAEGLCKAMRAIYAHATSVEPI